MGSPPPISIDGYDPYVSGWYLLPGAEPPALAWSAGLSLTPTQVDTINSHTLQGLIELVYVRVGNDVLYKGLDGLDDALEATTQTLNILSAVQELHNALQTSSLGSFSAWFKYDAAYEGSPRYQSNYNSVASAFFGVPIIPDFIFSSGEAVLSSGQSYADFAQKLADVRNQLSNQVGHLASLAAGTPDITDPNSLYNTTRQVLSDLPPIGTTKYAGVITPIAWSDAKLWAMDFYGAYEGQDLAQAKPTQVVIKYTGQHTVPGPWGDVSISPGRQIGMGTGFRSSPTEGVVAMGGNYASIRIVTPNGLMQAQIDEGGAQPQGTFFLTFSGRLAIGVNSDDADEPTMVMVNPINKDGEVQGAIVGDQRPTLKGGAVEMTDVGADVYIGTFGGITRGQAQNAGSFEQNITLAMTAAQGLNNSQTEQVRGYLFTFEEYYKSASSVLTSITQLIQKFAQGIRPA